MKRREILQELIQKGIRLRKRFGQHLMIDQRYLQKIVEIGEIDHMDQVIEVGTGTGALTQFLAERADRVVTVEIDPRLQSIAQKSLQNDSTIIWIVGDILQISQHQLTSYFSPNKSIKVVSNPPYAISTPLLEYFLGWEPKPDRLVFTFQKEVVDRMRAKAGTREYGSLSLFAQYFWNIEVKGRVPPSAFFPSPEVDSAIVVLRPQGTPPLDPEAEKRFFQIVRAVFQQRRKTLWNVLRKSFPKIDPPTLKAKIESTEIDPKIRGEKLSLERFQELAKAMPDTTGD